MLESEACRAVPESVCRFVQPIAQFSTRCCRGDVLKQFELQLQARGRLPWHGDRFYPLWFVAETERNVFLWRHGQSLADAAYYDMWYQLPELISKRSRHLERRSIDPSPLSILGDPFIDEGSILGELEYLAELGTIFDSVYPELHAMSLIASQLQMEARPAIALPVGAV